MERTFDALHLACAEAAGADIFVTCDDGTGGGADRRSRGGIAMTSAITNPVELRSRGFQALVKELGWVNAVRFLREYDSRHRQGAGA